MITMLLHAAKLRIVHPKSGESLVIEATPQAEFQRMLATLALTQG